MDSMKGSAPPSKQNTKPAASATPLTRASAHPVAATPFWEKYGHKSFAEYSEATAQAMVDNLNRNVLAEHERDLAMLPPEVRASRTPEQWLATPPLEILKLVRESRA